MGSLNKVMILGYIGRDMETRFTTGGTAVGTLSVATSESWKDKASGEKKEKTEWHRVVIWGETAERLAQYLVKGKQVLIEGSLQTREWEKDGVKRYTTEIKSQRVTLLGSAGDSEKGSGKAKAPASAGFDDSGAQEAEPNDDDIPF